MSILTSYRPNFCCECGSKIVRLRWFLWTSRRFCNKCQRAFARSHWLRPSITITAVIIFSMLIGRGCRRAPPPLIIERATHSATPPNAASAGARPSTAAAQSPTANEQAYTCGARTKKGTPCSRRVHGPVRCWQHKGAPAILPAEKLLVKE